MFYNCKSLVEVKVDINKYKIEYNAKGEEYLFSDDINEDDDFYFNIINESTINKNESILSIGTFNLLSLDFNKIIDTGVGNCIGIKNLSYMFYKCSSLLSIPDISQWNTHKVKSIYSMLYECSSLISLPDISQWNTKNIDDMGYLFYNCSSLISLPGISKWNTDN